jgi:hypothetical protein
LKQAKEKMAGGFYDKDTIANPVCFFYFTSLAAWTKSSPW